MPHSFLYCVSLVSIILDFVLKIDYKGLTYIQREYYRCCIWLACNVQVTFHCSPNVEYNNDFKKLQKPRNCTAKPTLSQNTCTLLKFWEALSALKLLVWIRLICFHEAILWQIGGRVWRWWGGKGVRRHGSMWWATVTRHGRSPRCAILCPWIGCHGDRWSAMPLRKGGGQWGWRRVWCRKRGHAGCSRNKRGSWRCCFAATQSR